MTIDTTSFAEAHARLRVETAELQDAAERLPNLDPAERAAARDEIVRWLHADVLPRNIGSTTSIISPSFPSENGLDPMAKNPPSTGGGSIGASVRHARP